MAETSSIRLEKADGVARLTLARPTHNVFNIDMMREFNDTIAELSADTELKCLAIFGDGPSWCAGVDVGDHKPEMVDEMIATFGRSFDLIEALEIPTVAAVHGACLGGGMEYAIACDIVIAGDGAKFGQPEVKLGFFPPYAAVRLPRLVGPAKAIEICTTGRIYSAAEALAMGFVSRVAAADAFTENVEKQIGEISASSPLILRLNKKAVKMHLGLAPADALTGANRLFLDVLMKTGDTLEGIASFEEKRRPEWKNR